MKCEACESTRTRVLSTRQSGARVLRARYCDDCQARWTTAELKLSELAILDSIKENAVALASRVIAAGGVR